MLDHQPSSSSSSERTEMLDFQTAMKDFKDMFPNIPTIEIESVLRKHDGDVSATINELLFDNSDPAVDIEVESVRIDQLKKRKSEIDEKLRKLQQLLENVTDVETARIYEDQQLAYLLEYRETKELLKLEKDKQNKTRNKNVPREINISSYYCQPRPISPFDDPQWNPIEARCPDGPYVTQMKNKKKISDQFKLIKRNSKFKLSRLFSPK